MCVYILIGNNNITYYIEAMYTYRIKTLYKYHCKLTETQFLILLINIIIIIYIYIRYIAKNNNDHTLLSC